jgi:DNA processing protein
MYRDELSVWLRLLETPQVGRSSSRKLLAAFGSPEAVIAASTSARREVVGLGPAAALATKAATLDALVDATLLWLAADSTLPRNIVTLGDDAFAPELLQSEDPPLLLYTQGRIELLHQPALAVVGSRNPTRQGAENAHAFSLNFSQANVVVVSGMALGIDASAHEGAMEGVGGTIAVVGTGLDRVYPRRHLALAHRIAERGLLVSEYALGTPPLPANFPNRNRIIAGLSRGTLVVEAALQSGSLITARLAAEAGREVFAIPGSIHSPQSRGCHALIQQGAKLVETAQDVLEELHWSSAPQSNTLRMSNSSTPQDSVLKALGFEPTSLDTLVTRTGQAPAVLSIQLLELEMGGLVSRLPGQLFQRTTRA